MESPSRRDGSAPATWDRQKSGTFISSRERRSRSRWTTRNPTPVRYELAFLFGWMCLLVMDPAVTASLATGLAGYFAYIVPLPLLAVRFVGVAVICGLCVMNIVSIRVSAAFLRWTTWLKLGLLGFLTIWAFAFRLGSWSNFAPFVAQRPGSLPLAPALGVGVVGAFFSFGGWWDVGKIAGEVRDPGRTLPRALLFGMLAVTVVYVVVSAVFLYLVPLDKVT